MKKILPIQYMEQPSVYIVERENNVCKYKKAIYGLQKSS